MSSRIELSIVMPCLNEAETLAICIQKAHEGVKNAGVDDYEIVIADNGSTDGSLEIAKDEGAIVVKVPQRGYGAALITGIQRASGKYIIMGDSDDSYDFSNLAPFVNELRNRRQLVMGTRIKGDIKPEAMPALHRYLGTPVLTFLGNLFFGSRLSDFNCGMRGFDRKAILNLSLISPGMEFASEMVIRAAMAGLDVVEIPIEYFPDGRTRPPYLQTWRDGWRHLNFMLVFSPRWLFLYPGILMTIVGLIGGLLLLPRPFVVGAITLDVHSLLFFSTILVAGTQLISFASVARIFASISGYLPKNEKLEAIVSKMSRGLLLIVGVLFSLAGVLLYLIGFYKWGASSFGSLDYQTTLRIIIPGTVLVIFGLQLFFSSFLFSILFVGRKYQNINERRVVT